MELLDKNLEIVLKKLLENKTESVSEEDCEQSEIDSLITNGYFTKKDVSTFSSWQYLIEPTQKGTINRHRDFSCFLDSGAAFIVTPLL